MVGFLHHGSPWRIVGLLLQDDLGTGFGGWDVVAALTPGMWGAGLLGVQCGARGEGVQQGVVLRVSRSACLRSQLSLFSFPSAWS